MSRVVLIVTAYRRQLQYIGGLAYRGSSGNLGRMNSGLRMRFSDPIVGGQRQAKAAGSDAIVEILEIAENRPAMRRGSDRNQRSGRARNVAMLAVCAGHRRQWPVRIAALGGGRQLAARRCTLEIESST